MFDLKSLHEKNVYARVAYCVGCKPTDYISGYMDGSASPETANAFKELLAKHNIEEINESTIPEIAQAARDDLFDEIITDDFVDKINRDIISKIEIAHSNGEQIDQVRVVAPFPVDPGETTNELAPAFAAVMADKIRESLPTLLEERGVTTNIAINAELDRDHIGKDDTILNIAKNRRSVINVQGDASNQTEGNMLEYASTLARQPVYNARFTVMRFMCR